MLFVVVTALLNLALGYGLAIYLGYGELPRLRRARIVAPVNAEGPAATAADETVAQESAAYATAPDPTAAMPTMASTAGLPDETVAETVTTAPPAATVTAPVESANDAAELEHEVLAGIEEFRNQLAQMKAQPAAAVVEPEETALAAARD